MRIIEPTNNVKLNDLRAERIVSALFFASGQIKYCIIQTIKYYIKAIVSPAMKLLTVLW